ncbi:GNAT family N-acetyltransferase [Dictyobacter aurantiacus]|uniref:GNAT family N-acetyltransferase n=1 Tax=Dictyobacter aurantiacus TaxID=1936993 RepID=A0A401ZQM7_9CHLR|nr:GNAT family N-acetyltransferase [Dictyobacter aurantiacus]GCE09132.1 GNAT family N-acetyltransferase [Dictyobacter aurantiacus]
MKIRQYRPADQGAVWALHKAALHGTGADLEDEQWDADLFQIEEVYLDNQGEFLVGEIENRIVAMGAIKKITSTRSEIKRMRVHPDFQKRGLGQMMLTRLEARAIALGYQVLQLDTTTLQVAAQQLYRKNGFVQLEQTETIKGLTVLFFEKDLPTLTDE